MQAVEPEQKPLVNNEVAEQIKALQKAFLSLKKNDDGLDLAKLSPFPNLTLQQV